MASADHTTPMGKRRRSSGRTAYGSDVAAPPSPASLIRNALCLRLNLEAKQIAIDKLANSMRIYAEASIRFPGLKLVDMEEAVNNLDRAFESKLEAFHSLYDITRSEFEYFGHADTALLIVLRNAVHHRDHLLFKSWNHKMLLKSGFTKYSGAAFLLANFEVGGGVYTGQYYYKLDDVLDRLDSSRGSPYLASQMRPPKRDRLMRTISEGLNFDKIFSFASSERYPTGQIYLNLIPVFISGMVRVFSHLKSTGMVFKGYDSDVYRDYFTSGLNVNFDEIAFKRVRLP